MISLRPQGSFPCKWGEGGVMVLESKKNKTLSGFPLQEHYSFSRSKYFHLLIAPIEGFIILIG